MVRVKIFIFSTSAEKCGFKYVDLSLGDKVVTRGGALEVYDHDKVIRAFAPDVWVDAVVFDD